LAESRRRKRKRRGFMKATGDDEKGGRQGGETINKL
jgi:hypothetical protein